MTLLGKIFTVLILIIEPRVHGLFRDGSCNESKLEDEGGQPSTG